MQYEIEKDFWATPDWISPTSVYRPVEELVFALIEQGITYEQYLNDGSKADLGENYDRG